MTASTARAIAGPTVPWIASAMAISRPRIAAIRTNGRIRRRRRLSVRAMSTAAPAEPAPVGELLLGCDGDRGHHLHCGGGVAADGGLLGEHHRIGPVEDGV